MEPLCSSCYSLSCDADHPDLHSFPTRRSSDLQLFNKVLVERLRTLQGCCQSGAPNQPARDFAEQRDRAGYILGSFVDEDRKSTRLNSSHANISYAVFCLKKKTSRLM